jgi:hypothetical protein
VREEARKTEEFHKITMKENYDKNSKPYNYEVGGMV